MRKSILDSDWLKPGVFVQRKYDETEDERRIRMIMILGLLGGFLIAGISVYDLFFLDDGRHIGVVIALIIAGLAFIGHSIYIKLYGKPFVVLLIILVVMLHWFWLFSGNEARAGMLWTLVILPSFYYFLGHQKGLVVATVVGVASAALLFSERTFITLAPFTDQFKERYLMAYFALSFSCFVIESLHYTMRKGLSDTKQQLVELAKTDQLTGLNNRHGFFESFNIERSNQERRNQASGENYSIVLLDIDHFKAVNDEFGHMAGDEVLIVMAHLIRLAVREHDVVTRWGGEELIIFMPKTPLKESKMVAERIRKIICEHQFTDRGLTLTASFGVAVADYPAQDVNEVVRKADRAMYEAKNSGRNKVVAVA